ncbi:MAG: cation diffusion facilitator family transporter [Candidatus Pacebacteria bacterium]|nr:cation diffusion facilitator family transporter [Candidatus Paceibacterota bacterium]
MTLKEAAAIRAVKYSILANIGLALIKWFSGIFGNSYALIADAIESTSDVFSSILVLLGLNYSTLPPDEDHPYGHGKIEPLVTFLVVGFLVASALLIAHDSIQNIQTPHDLPKPWTLIILGAIIIWKEISYRLVIKKSKETNSSSLKAEAWHHRSDAITSVAAFIGIVFALFLGENFAAADDYAALFASGFILYNSYLIFRPAFAELMDENVYDELTQKIREESIKVRGVKGTEKCHIRKTGMSYHLDLHALVDGKISVAKGHKISHNLKDKLIEYIPELRHVTIHIEPS